MAVNFDVEFRFTADSVVSDCMNSPEKNVQSEKPPVEENEMGSSKITPSTIDFVC
jgi:hypothetical protein